jgi:uroporphyrinogen-III synthase
VADNGLAGRIIVLLEARRARELSDLVRRYGGEPWSVPSMQELPPDDTSESVTQLRKLCDGGTDVMICLTGVGTRRLFELASRLDLESRLREIFDTAIVVVRGPKPTAVLRDLGVRIDRTAAEPNTTQEVLDAIKDDAFERVAVQLYGGPDPDLRAGLEARGATVLELPLYRWALPDDVQPMRELIDGLDRADALCVTSATQIHNLFAVAEREDSVVRLSGGLTNLTVAAVGPVAAAALRDHGVHVDLQPEHPHMGTLIRDLSRYFAERRS